LAHRTQQVLALALLSVAVGFWGQRWILLLSPLARNGAPVFRQHRWFIGSAAVATLFYTWLVTMGSFQLFYPEYFGSFYDYQAASLLQGQLDVPEDAIGGEAFEARGKLYGYFGPTPALLRMPLAIFGFAFGKVSRLYLVLYFAAALLASYQLLRHALSL